MASRMAYQERVHWGARCKFYTRACSAGRRSRGAR